MLIGALIGFTVGMVLMFIFNVLMNIKVAYLNDNFSNRIRGITYKYTPNFNKIMFNVMTTTSVGAVIGYFI